MAQATVSGVPQMTILDSFKRFFRPSIIIQTYHTKKAINERKAIHRRTEQLRRELGLSNADLPWAR